MGQFSNVALGQNPTVANTGRWGLEVFGYCSTCRTGVRAVALDPGTDGWAQSVLGRADVDHVSFTCRDCGEPVLYRLQDLLWLPCPQCGTASLVTRLERKFPPSEVGEMLCSEVVTVGFVPKV